MPEALENIEAESKPLKRIVARFRRHFDPQKDPETMRSLDKLSEKGVTQAGEVGSSLEVPASGIAARVSPKQRAHESAELELEAAGELKRFNMRERKALDTIDMGASAEASAEFSKIAKEQGFDAAVQYLLDTPLLAEQRQKVAGGFARLIDQYVKMIDKVKEGTDLAVEDITHGPNLEVFLREAMVKDGKKGFDKVEEIGGAFKPGEEFAVDVEQLETGKRVALEMRGNQYDLDVERVTELAQEYKESGNEL